MKNENLNGKGTAKDVAVKNATVKKDKEAPKNAVPQKPSVEDLVRENEELKKKLATAPMDLAEKISFFQQKQELISKLDFLKENERVLLLHRKRLDNLAEEDEFSNNVFSLSFVYENYNNSEQDVFKFKNPVVLGEVIDFVLGRVKEKKENLEAEINA